MERGTPGLYHYFPERPIVTDQFPTSFPCLFVVILISMPALKLHKNLLSKLAVIDCLHNDVCCNGVCFIAATNKYACITELIDQPWCAIGGI